jgi:protein phosphatase
MVWLLTNKPRWLSTSLSHTGHLRPRNEDAIHSDDSAGLWLVADGMGGHAGGDVASKLVCETTAAACALGEPLDQAIKHAHETVLAKAQAEPALSGMGSTLVAVQAQGRYVQLAWVGDSRIYLWRKGQLSLLSRDHSFVQDMLYRGVLSPEEAREHPQKHLVNQALGQANLRQLKVDLQRHKLACGDRLLLCTDGVHDLLPDAAIAKCLSDEIDDVNAAQRLQSAVLATTASDNFSFILLSAEPFIFGRWLKSIFVKIDNND